MLFHIITPSQLLRNCEKLSEGYVYVRENEVKNVHKHYKKKILREVRKQY